MQDRSPTCPDQSLSVAQAIIEEVAGVVDTVDVFKTARAVKVDNFSILRPAPLIFIRETMRKRDRHLPKKACTNP